MEPAMQIKPEILFRNTDSSEAIKSVIEKKIRHLEAIDSRLTRCRVTVESPHHHQKQGLIYHVHIDLTLPGAELNVSHSPGGHEAAHEDVYTAINEAFMALEKKLVKHNQERRGIVKHHAQRLAEKRKLAA
jgi:ribosomal subunit interface protein